MFNFGGITHVIANPVGHAPGYNYSLVGSVPASMLVWKPATYADIMAGRAVKDGSGNLVSTVSHKWETVDEIMAAAHAVRATMCSSPTCACRKLF